MTGIIIATHGKLSQGLYDAANLIMGEQDSLSTVSLFEGMDLNEFSDNLIDALKEIECNTVLIFVDLFGATPLNTVIKMRDQIYDLNVKTSLIYGVNLPMILEAITMRESMDINSLTNHIELIGKESIGSLSIKK